MLFKESNYPQVWGLRVSSVMTEDLKEFIILVDPDHKVLQTLISFQVARAYCKISCKSLTFYNHLIQFFMILFLRLGRWGQESIVLMSSLHQRDIQTTVFNDKLQKWCSCQGKKRTKKYVYVLISFNKNEVNTIF